MSYKKLVAYLGLSAGDLSKFESFKCGGKAQLLAAGFNSGTEMPLRPPHHFVTLKSVFKFKKESVIVTNVLKRQSIP